MIRQPKFLPGTQDLYCRRVYVIRARPELIVRLKEADQVEEEDLEFLQCPTVVMTPEVPFERDLEGWRLMIEKKCIEAFVVEGSIEVFIPILDPPDGLLKEQDVTVAFFDRWWVADEAEDIELEDGVWKEP